MENEPVWRNYIITNNNEVVSVPQVYVARDKNAPIQVSAEWWREKVKEHSCISASTFTTGYSFSSKSIVVLRRVDPSSQDGVSERCMWCVRLSVNGGCSKFGGPFGRTFLWQLPYRTCIEMIEDMKEMFCSSRNQSASSSLLGVLRPTHHNFKIEDWPECERINRIDDYYDRTFFMSVKPESIKGPAYPQKRRLVTRPVNARSLHPFFSASAMPDDILYHIMQQTVKELVKSPDPTDWSHLLSLRSCSKELFEIVEDESNNFIRKLLNNLLNGYNSRDVEIMTIARDSVLNAGIATLPLICNAADPTILTLMRLRHPIGRHFSEHPPFLSKVYSKKRSRKTTYVPSKWWLDVWKKRGFLKST